MFSLFVLSAVAATPSLATGKHLSKAGELCGGIAGFQCMPGLWCDPELGSCGFTNAAGLCIEFRPFCTREYRPVCGCNGKTYGNDCDRKADRAAKRHDGPCQ